MTILYISYDGMTDQLGQSQVIPYLAGLSKNGHQFHLISAEKEENYNKGKLAIAKLLEDNNIIWHPIPYTKKPPILSTIFDIFNIIRHAKQLHRKYQFDAVHCRSYISAFAGLLLKKKFGVKFIFDIRGFYADERVDGHIWDINKFVYKKVYNYFKAKEIEFFSHADYSICLTENGKTIIHSWAKITNQPIPIQVIPCCADLNHFDSAKVDQQKRNELIQKYEIKDNQLIISYLGSIGTWYLLDEMLHFFSRLLIQKTNAKFLFISPDPASLIEKHASKFGITPSQLIVQRATRNEVPIFLSLSSISIFFIRPVFSKKASSPTKMGEIMSMGIPIICNSNVGDVDLIMQNTNAGALVNNFTEKDYDMAIASIDDMLKLPKDRIKEAAFEHYALEKGVEKYNEVYELISNS